MSPRLPDDCFQTYVGEFWKPAADKQIHRGTLVWAFVPHVDVIPKRLSVVGRGDEPSDHSTATYQLDTLRISDPPARSQLPVAALPAYPGETLIVSRAKKRPCVVLGPGGVAVDRRLTGGSHPRWQTNQTMTVAPFYGTELSGTRGGWNHVLVDRIRRGEYPQYVWDVG
jgi:hypothetical protein